MTLTSNPRRDLGKTRQAKGVLTARRWHVSCSRARTPLARPGPVFRKKRANAAAPESVKVAFPVMRFCRGPDDPLRGIKQSS